MYFASMWHHATVLHGRRPEVLVIFFFWIYSSFISCEKCGASASTKFIQTSAADVVSGESAGSATWLCDGCALLQSDLPAATPMRPGPHDSSFAASGIAQQQHNLHHSSVAVASNATGPPPAARATSPPPAAIRPRAPSPPRSPSRQSDTVFAPMKMPTNNAQYAVRTKPQRETQKNSPSNYSYCPCSPARNRIPCTVN